MLKFIFFFHVISVEIPISFETFPGQPPENLDVHTREYYLWKINRRYTLYY
jgi:hypothetical protein